MLPRLPLRASAFPRYRCAVPGTATQGCPIRSQPCPTSFLAWSYIDSPTGPRCDSPRSEETSLTERLECACSGCPPPTRFAPHRNAPRGPSHEHKQPNNLLRTPLGHNRRSGFCGKSPDGYFVVFRTLNFQAVGSLLNNLASSLTDDGNAPVTPPKGWRYTLRDRKRPLQQAVRRQGKYAASPPASRTSGYSIPTAHYAQQIQRLSTLSWLLVR